MRPAVVAVGLVLVAGLALRGHNASRATAPVAPRPNDPSPVVTVEPAVKETGRRVIASAKTDNERCDVPGVVNGVPLTLEIDTGDPVVIDFPGKFVKTLGLKPGPYEEFSPGTRYGKIASATVREIRVGDVVWLNEQARVYSNWSYTFGNDEIPLLGLAALRSHGVHVEFEGDMCRLTVAQSSAPAQCNKYSLSKLRGDETLRRCKGECSAVPFCRGLTER